MLLKTYFCYLKLQQVIGTEGWMAREQEGMLEREHLSRQGTFTREHTR